MIKQAVLALPWPSAPAHHRVPSLFEVARLKTEAAMLQLRCGCLMDAHCSNGGVMLDDGAGNSRRRRELRQGLLLLLLSVLWPLPSRLLRRS